MGCEREEKCASGAVTAVSGVGQGNTRCPLHFSMSAMSGDIDAKFVVPRPCSGKKMADSDVPAALAGSALRHAVTTA
jgi:hypothetical protein